MLGGLEDQHILTERIQNILAHTYHASKSKLKGSKLPIT